MPILVVGAQCDSRALPCGLGGPEQVSGQRVQLQEVMIQTEKMLSVGGLAADERDDGDAVDDLRAQRVRRCHTSRSTTIANPIPPAAQTVMRPNCPSRLRSSLRSVTVIREPVAPNGCPIEIEPPITVVIEELGGDVRLQVGKRKDQIRLQVENLRHIGRNKS